MLKKNCPGNTAGHCKFLITRHQFTLYILPVTDQVESSCTDQPWRPGCRTAGGGCDGPVRREKPSPVFEFSHLQTLSARSPLERQPVDGGSSSVRRVRAAAASFCRFKVKPPLCSEWSMKLRFSQQELVFSDKDFGDAPVFVWCLSDIFHTQRGMCKLRYQHMIAPNTGLCALFICMVEFQHPHMKRV